MIQMKSITLATNNVHKKVKLTQIVRPIFNEIRELPWSLDSDESADTFKGNAELKAEEASRLFGGYAIATDGGVLIPALGNKWNALLTRRFLGKKNVTDWDRLDGLLGLMKDVRGSDRVIIWKEAVAIAYEGKIIFSIEVEGDRGELQTSYNREQYRPGIWQCTLTCYPQFGYKNFFELNDEELQYAELSWIKIKDEVQNYFKNTDL